MNSGQMSMELGASELRRCGNAVSGAAGWLFFRLGFVVLGKYKMDASSLRLLVYMKMTNHIQNILFD